MATDYQVEFSEIFDAPCAVVYGGLTNLRRYPEWNAGMLEIDGPERMSEGLVYRTSIVANGKLSESRILVEELTPNQLIVLSNTAGLISYFAEISLEELPDDHTRVTCKLNFSVAAGLIDAAAEVIEEMTVSRIRANWDNLKRLL